jgi:hypothetical protein
LLVGFTSEEQMKYDENVLNDIMKELGGIPRPTKPSDESWIKNADSAGMWLMCGSYVSVDYVIETLSQATGHGESYAALKKKYTPPLMPDYGDPGWFQSFELGHQATLSSSSTGTQTKTPQGLTILSGNGEVSGGEGSPAKLLLRALR